MTPDLSGSFDFEPISLRSARGHLNV